MLTRYIKNSMTNEFNYKIQFGSNIRFSPELLSEQCDCFLGREKLTIPRKGMQKLFVGISQINTVHNSLTWSLQKRFKI